MIDPHSWLPLFPLHTVLFPDGILPLRIFEARYLDMVRHCLKQEAPFGVVLIRNGAETGTAAEPENVGCLAHVIDWDAQEDGLLLLRTQGSRRFRIIETRVRSNDQLDARVELWSSDEPLRVPQRHAICSQALELLINDINQRGQDEEGEAFVSPFPARLRLEDAGWVANRWSEILPLSSAARQQLLEMQDPLQRLAMVYEYLQQHQVI